MQFVNPLHIHYCSTRVNAMTVFPLEHGKSSSAIDAFELGWDLYEELVLPYARARSTNDLSLETQMKLCLLLRSLLPGAVHQGSVCPPSVSKRWRCHHCVKSLVGKPGYKEKKNRLGKAKLACTRCEQLCCSKHVLQVVMREGLMGTQATEHLNTTCD